MPKHLKVVDIMVNGDENTEKIEVKDDNVIKQQSELIEQINPIINDGIKNTEKIEVKDDNIIPSELIEKPVIKENVKVSHLVNCPRCNRKMTNRTLLYGHEKLCKKRDEIYIPKSIKKRHLRATDLIMTVKEALTIIENEKQIKNPIEKQEKQIKNPIEKQDLVVTAHQPIKQHIMSNPLHNDLRKERIVNHNAVMTNLFKNAF
jgi:hypothetical protein